MRLRRIPLAAALVLGLVAGAACKADDGDDAGPASSLLPPQSTESDTESSTTEAAPTSTSEPATTEPSQPTATTDQAADAVNELVTAWQAGDQERAATIAPGDVVEALFAVPPDGFELYGCDSGEFETSTCNLRNRSTEAFVVVTAARTDAGWQIDTIDINQD